MYTESLSYRLFTQTLTLTYPQAPQHECPRGWMRSATHDEVISCSGVGLCLRNANFSFHKF